MAQKGLFKVKDLIMTIQNVKNFKFQVLSHPIQCQNHAIRYLRIVEPFNRLINFNERTRYF